MKYPLRNILDHICLFGIFARLFKYRMINEQTQIEKSLYNARLSGNREICSRAMRCSVRAVLVVGWFYESEVEWQGLERIWKFKRGATLLDRQRVKPTFKSKWLTTFQTPFHWLALKVAHQKSIFGISFLNGGGGVTFYPFLFLDSKVSEKTSIHSGFFQMVFAEGGSVNGEETPANAQLFQIVFKMLCYYQLINRQKKLLFSVILFYTHLFERKKWKSVIVITMIVLIVVFRFDVTWKRVLCWILAPRKELLWSGF